MLPESFETRRLLLRRPRADDALPIFEGYAQDSDVTRYLMWLPHASVETTKAFIAGCHDEWESGETFAYVLTLKPVDAPIGMIELRPNELRAELGFVLARRHWGEGLTPEAASILVAIALAQPDIFRVQAMCDIDNHASARVLEKAGLRLEGTVRRFALHPNISPEPRDALLYAITR